MQRLRAAYSEYVRFGRRLESASGDILPFVCVTAAIGGLLLCAAVTRLHFKLPLLLTLALGIGFAVFRTPHWGLVLLVSLSSAQGVRLLSDSGLSTLPRLAGVLLVAALISKYRSWSFIRDRKNRTIVIFGLASLVSLYAAIDLQIGLKESSTINSSVLA